MGNEVSLICSSSLIPERWNGCRGLISWSPCSLNLIPTFLWWCLKKIILCHKWDFNDVHNCTELNARDFIPRQTVSFRDSSQHYRETRLQTCDTIRYIHCTDKPPPYEQNVTNTVVAFWNDNWIILYRIESACFPSFYNCSGGYQLTLCITTNCFHSEKLASTIIWHDPQMISCSHKRPLKVLY